MSRTDAPAGTDLLRARIEADQEAAYRTLGLAETLHLILPPEVISASAPDLIERILARHYADQTRATQRHVRRALRDGLVIRDKQSSIRSQNERYHRHLMNYWQLIGRHVPAFVPEGMAPPLVATMPIPQLNAQTWTYPELEGYAIVFNEALLTFLFLLAKVVARYFPGRFIPGGRARHKGHMSVLFDRAHINRVLSTDPSGLQDLIHLLTGHIYKGNPLADTRPYLLDLQPTFVASQLVLFSELFVFAHELAHVAHGDLQGEAPVRVDGLGEEFDTARPGQQRELAADAGALLALIAVSERALGPHNLSLAYWGAELFLEAVQLAQRAVTFVKFGHEDLFHADTHPRVEVRRASLRRVLRHHMARDSVMLPGYPEWQVAESHADMLVDLLDALWRDARRALAVARSTGHPISPRWDAVRRAA